MAEVTILIDGKPFHLDDEGMAALAALRKKMTFGGLEPTTEYGDVDVEINGQTYTLRIGMKEWWALEDAFKPVKGAKNLITYADSSEKALAEMYRIALSRKHKLTLEQVGELMDFKVPEGSPTLRDALTRCLHFSKPAVFTGEERDPKGQMALEAALMAVALETKTPESTTS